MVIQSMLVLEKLLMAVVAAVVDKSVQPRGFFKCVQRSGYRHVQKSVATDQAVLYGGELCPVQSDIRPRLQIRTASEGHREHFLSPSLVVLNPRGL
uniref:Small rab-related GTPase n=1 Tax=Ulva partita TaxID=1605170 RepID=A0A1C9ZPM7_9CHLO|nr:small rab-related GTPase [Ulva partita]